MSSSKVVALEDRETHQEAIPENEYRALEIEAHELGVTVAAYLETQVRLYARALNEAAIVTVTDPRGVILDVNQRFCDLLGHQREDLVGKTHEVISSGHHDASFWQEMWETVNSGEVWHGEILNQSKTGAAMWFDTFVIPIQTGSAGAVRYFSICYDITERKRLENEASFSAFLQGQSEIVSGLIHNIGNIVAGAKGANERALKKAQGISDLIKAMDGYLQSTDDPKRAREILDKFSEILDKNSKEMQSEIESSQHKVEHVSDIVGAHRALAKVGDVRSVNVEEWLQDAIRLVSHLGPTIRFDLEVDGVSSVFIPANQVMQVVVNFVKNAIEAIHDQFGRDPLGVIRVRGEASDKSLRVDVSDNGVGLSDVEVEKLRKKTLYTSKAQGTGIGLHTSRMTIERLKGELFFESDGVGKGSVFSFTIPSGKGV